MCEITMPTAQSASSAGWQTIGVLPGKYRPLIVVRGMGYDNNATSLAQAPCIFQIFPNGTIQWYAMGAVSGIVPIGTFTYVSSEN